MVRSPWWTRVWTLQEQVLATKCEAYHGRQSISMLSLIPRHLLDTVALMTRGYVYQVQDAGHVMHLFCLWCDDMQQFSPDDIPLRLEEYKSFYAAFLLEVAFLLESKRPMDKIYGLYTILTVYCGLPLSAPDYDKTAEEVYEETAWSWINSRGDLGILKLAGRPNLDHKLPSWVPAWHQAHPRAIRNTGVSPEMHTFFRRGHFNWDYGFKVNRSASEISSRLPTPGKDTSTVASLISPGKLCVFQARFAGRVSQAVGPDRSKEFAWYRDSVEALYVHLEWCGLIRDVFFHDYTQSEEVHALRELFRSLLEPGLHQWKPELGEKGEQSFESFRAWFDFILYLQDATELPDSVVSGETDADPRDLAVRLYHNVRSTAQEDEAVEHLEAGYRGEAQERETLSKLARYITSTAEKLAFTRSHRLCILDNDNMIAVTDFWCKEGDEIFVFPGTDSPFVLRKEPNRERYRLVGPALVDRLFRIGYQEWRSEGDDLQDIVLI